jgi:hypothetical protein
MVAFRSSTRVEEPQAAQSSGAARMSRRNIT